MLIFRGSLMLKKADTYRRFVVAKLQAAGWDDEPHAIREQVTLIDGRIVVRGNRTRRYPGRLALTRPGARKSVRRPRILGLLTDSS